MKTIALISVVGFAGSAFAGELGDVGFVLENGQLNTVVADDVDENWDPTPERVFGAEMAFDGTNFLADEPGFFINDDDTRPNADSNIEVGSTLRYNTVAAVQEWDGSAFVASNAQIAQIQGLDTIFTPTTDSVVAGFDYIYGGGAFDEHPDFGLVNGGAGLYLLQLQFFLDDASGNALDATDTIFLVFNAGLDDTIFDEGIEYVEDVLVPTPGAAGVLAMGGLLATRRRR